MYQKKIWLHKTAKFIFFRQKEKQGEAEIKKTNNQNKNIACCLIVASAASTAFKTCNKLPLLSVMLDGSLSSKLDSFSASFQSKPFSMVVHAQWSNQKSSSIDVVFHCYYSSRTSFVPTEHRLESKYGKKLRTRKKQILNWRWL